MILQELIDLLREQPDARLVRYSTNTGDGRPLYPDTFASWRGVYAQLTLAPSREPVTCGQLLARAEDADGAVFEGWKGGEYSMDGSSPVWADDVGECDYWMIAGHRLDGDVLVLDRVQLPEYRQW